MCSRTLLSSPTRQPAYALATSSGLVLCFPPFNLPFSSAVGWEKGSSELCDEKHDIIGSLGAFAVNRAHKDCLWDSAFCLGWSEALQMLLPCVSALLPTAAGTWPMEGESL